MKLKRLYYGWVMVILAIFVLALHTILIYTFGIFLRPLTMEFGWERGALSAALSMTMLAAGGLGILAGRLTDKYGPRLLLTNSGVFIGIGYLLMSQVNSLWQVYVIWGLIMAVGSGSCTVPVVSTIPRWFAKRRGLAVGIAGTGYGLGGTISPPLAQWFISVFGWRQAYVALGLITFIVLISVAQFMKHSPQRVGLKPYGESGAMGDKQSPASATEGLSSKQAIKTGRFWLFGLVLLCILFDTMIIRVHIAPYAVDSGISEMMAASILSIIAASSLVGRLFIGFISDKIGARRALTACIVTATSALIWLLFAKEIWMFYVFAVIFGIPYGGRVSLQPLVAAELFGLSSLGVIYGGLMVFAEVGGAIGIPLAGVIFDVTGSYREALLICVTTAALAIILSLILLRLKGGTVATE